MIFVNMNKARGIARESIRQERDPMLKELDVQFMRAVEGGDTALQQDIAQNKQKLRDAPSHPDIDGAKTPEELRDFILGWKDVVAK